MFARGSVRISSHRRRKTPKLLPTRWPFSLPAVKGSQVPVHHHDRPYNPRQRERRDPNPMENARRDRFGCCSAPATNALSQFCLVTWVLSRVMMRRLVAVGCV